MQNILYVYNVVKEEVFFSFCMNDVSASLQYPSGKRESDIEEMWIDTKA